MCLGKDDLIYILNICLFHKSLKYFLNEKQEGQHRDYFALIYETGNKKWMPYESIQRAKVDNREYFNTKSGLQIFKYLQIKINE